MELASLAKREETIHREGHDDIVLDRRGRLLVHARDEAHRFVNKFHRKNRAKKRLSIHWKGSWFRCEKIAVTHQALGGRQGIKHASVNDLKTVPGIGPHYKIFDSCINSKAHHHTYLNCYHRRKGRNYRLKEGLDHILLSGHNQRLVLQSRYLTATFTRTRRNYLCFRFFLELLFRFSSFLL